MDSLSFENFSSFYEEHKSELLIGGVVVLGGWMLWRLTSSKNKKEVSEQNNGGGASELTLLENGDVLNYPLPHCKPGTEQVAFRGLPDGFNWKSLKQIWSLIFELGWHLSHKSVDFLNARVRDLKFEDCGFTIIPFKDDFDMKEWKTKEAQEKFKAQITPILEEMFPGAVMAFEYMSFLFRGGEGNNPPAVDGPHLDSYPDWKLVQETSSWGKNDKYGHANEEYYSRLPSSMYIGLWKPINMPNPVHDYPLAMMDASTLKSGEVVKFITDMSHINNGQVEHFVNLGGHITHNPDQKWYYYPDMTNDEMIIFTHMGQNESGCCPHTSFSHPGAPEDKGSYTSRMSMETRIFLHFPDHDQPVDVANAAEN